MVTITVDNLTVPSRNVHHRNQGMALGENLARLSVYGSLFPWERNSEVVHKPLASDVSHMYRVCRTDLGALYSNLECSGSR